MKSRNFPADNTYSGIHFFNESSHSLPVDEPVGRHIASLIEQCEQFNFQLVEIVLVDETEIVRLNREHLDRGYVTDIITFRYDEESANNAIEGTLYCCAPRITEQAKEYDEPPAKEFKRIIIHGLLHLAGYTDQSDAEQKRMRQRENFYLDQLA